MKPQQRSDQQRSDNLLPADDQVAEEVSTDQQSEQARKTGHAPAQPAAAPDVDKAVADTLGGVSPGEASRPDSTGDRRDPRSPGRT